MQIDHPFEQPPRTGTAQTVADGVEWLRMPLPFALDHINLWLLADGEGWTAVDTGIASDQVRTAWKSALAGRRLTRQIVTHFHPDHVGLAAWLEAETGAPLWMTQGEFLTAHAVAEGLPPFGIPSMVIFFRRHGLDDLRAGALEQRGNAYRRGVPALPATFRPLIDGDEVTIGGQTWQVIVGHGHAPEHASLYCAERKLLIAGDMLLPRITTNVSAYASAPVFDTLARYLESIDALRALPADTLVLPSHGLPFRGLHARIDELHLHHAERCADLLAACREGPRSACELLPVLFGRTIDDPHQTLFAMGEAIAHLNYLAHRQRITPCDEDGIIRYTLKT